MSESPRAEIRRMGWELRALAEAALPGPWANLDGGSFGNWYVSRCVDGNPDPAGAIVTATRDLKTGDYLAAVDPSTVLALLDRLEEAEALLERILDSAERERWYTKHDHYAKWVDATRAFLAAGEERQTLNMRNADVVANNFAVTVECPVCRGTGGDPAGASYYAETGLLDDECEDCGGTGTIPARSGDTDD